MKYAILLLPLLLASCSSAAKKDPTTQPSAQATAKPMPISSPSPSPTLSAAPSAMAKVKSHKAKELSTEDAHSETSASPLEMHCKQGTDDRVLTIVPKSPGCELSYVKLGKGTSIASSSVSSKYCEDIRAKVREHLEAAGFQCQ